MVVPQGTSIGGLCRPGVRPWSQAGTEDAVHAHDRAISGLDQIRDDGLHPGGSGSGQRDGKFVLSPERRPEQRLDVIHEAEEYRVEVSEKRQREGMQNTGVHHARAWTHEQAMRGNES